VFRKIYVEITNVCNLACDFCPPTDRPTKFLSVDQFDAVLDRLAGHGQHLYFHVKGEPLIHPDLGALLARAGDRAHRVTLTTNGTKLGDRAQLLLASPVVRQVNVSLHSHAGLDGGSYWRGLETFLDAHRRSPVFPVSLRVWNRTKGAPPPGMASLWELLRSRYPVVGPWDEAGALPQGTELDRQVFLNFDEPFAWPGDRAQDHPTGFCHGLTNQIAVLVDGTVVPCCLDGNGRMALGNVFETPLADLMATPRARAIREGLHQGRRVEALCRTCGFTDRLA
jgi:radical SAM protein with 4Fe4S-binding SPASM domain